MLLWRCRWRYLAAYREPDGSIRLTDREREEGRTRYRDYRIKPDGSYALIVDRLGDFDPRTRPWWPVAEESDERRGPSPFSSPRGASLAWCWWSVRTTPRAI
ncbi:hypothetical protein AUC71_10035 [Methyloceanibacter marginalis]|uniref:Uncharacterized protein n=1 Tax=Methyloceanibacter marginalis TaxID=1774971 RepID=A0A1E3WC24_9HYPH|nr:hypothetical protein [Methyloceanibacter marginalis]ODS03364.1 hypothetical protein AUC71_10035 [Methyloceanibacter marginalis]